MNNEASSTPKTHNKLLLIPPPQNGSLMRSTELAPWLAQGWSVLDSSPRIMEDGAKILVVLGRDATPAHRVPLRADKEAAAHGLSVWNGGSKSPAGNDRQRGTDTTREARREPVAVEV